MGGDLGQAYKNANTQAPWPEDFRERLCRVADMLKAQGYEADVSDLYGDPKPGKKLFIRGNDVVVHAYMNPSKMVTWGVLFRAALRDTIGAELPDGRDSASLYIDEVNGHRQAPFKSEYVIDTPKEAQRLARSIIRFMESQAPAVKSERKPGMP